MSVDFTAFEHPVLAVRCPHCRRRPGAWCIRPSDHKAMDLHAERKREADRIFVAQHGEDAVLENTSLASDKPRQTGLGIWRLHRAARRVLASRARSDPPAVERRAQLGLWDGAQTPLALAPQPKA